MSCVNRSFTEKKVVFHVLKLIPVSVGIRWSLFRLCLLHHKIYNSTFGISLYPIPRWCPERGSGFDGSSHHLIFKAWKKSHHRDLWDLVTKFRNRKEREGEEDRQLDSLARGVWLLLWVIIMIQHDPPHDDASSSPLFKSFFVCLRQA